MPTATRACHYCGARRPDDLAACPHCGAGARDSTDDPFETHTPTILVGKNRSDCGVRSLVVAAPGATSQTTLSDSGAVAIELSGSKGLGKYGEQRVKHVLYERLSREPEFKRQSGARDELGEDDLIWLSDRKYVLQVVSALSEHQVDFRLASTGTATVQTSIDQIATWLEQTIRAKTLSTNPPETVLALDCNHLGAIVDPSLVDVYHRRLGSPSSFGFASIWIVGSTVEQCLRLDLPPRAAT